MKDFPFSDSETTRTPDSMPLTSVIESYVRYYATGSSHTARAKRLDLKKFTDFLCSYKGHSGPQKLRLSDWDFSSVQRFVDESLGKGEAPATVARRLATLKHMGRTLSEKISGFTNPAKEVKPPKVRPPKPKGLSKQEVVSVQKNSKKRIDRKSSFIRLRNQTIFEFLIDTGLRADEVRALRMRQLDKNLEWVHNVRTKGRRYRNVYITSEMRPRIVEYLEARGKELTRFYRKLTKKEDAELPVFISSYGAKAGTPDSFLMGAKTIWRAVNELSAGTHLHPHLLRHSFALELLDNSNDVRLVAQALGHSDVRITMRYTERADQEVARALEKTRKAKQG